MASPWTIAGAEGEPIIGSCHLPEGVARGVAVIAHGFKGYKDYGMFPAIAARMAAAGLVAHRFNFSHSGMTERIETFERPDLFERDTWSKQVTDLRAVTAAIADGTLEGRGLPLLLFGHSRGGVSVLLTAGRAEAAGDERWTTPAGIVTASAPSSCSSLQPEQAELLLAQGWIESPSSRTGQALRVGKGFLTEQQEDPAGHDLLALVARITSPMLIVHGTADPTVPADCARRITAANPRAELLLIDGGDHVFNTPNPFAPDARPSRQLVELLTAMAEFVEAVIGH